MLVNHRKGIQAEASGVHYLYEHVDAIVVQFLHASKPLKPVLDITSLLARKNS